MRDIDALKLRKRRGYGTRTLIGACLVRTIYAFPTWTRTVRLIEEHAALADAIGGTPSVPAYADGQRFLSLIHISEPTRPY